MGYRQPFRRAPQANAPFLPSALPDLAAWFRYGVGIRSSSGAVSQWEDQSGNGRHLKQSTGANQPELQSDGSILFDGAAHYLKCDAFTLDQPFSVYLAVNVISWESLDCLIDGDTGGSAMIRQRVGEPQIEMHAGLNVGTISPTQGAYCVINAHFNATASSIQLNLDTAVSGSGGAQAAGGFTLGGFGDGTTRWANIRVKEVVVCSNVHATRRRNNIIKYLAQIGGVSL